MQYTVLLDHQVDLPLVLVPVEGQCRAAFGVSIGPQQLADYIILKEMTGGGAVHQRIPTGPGGEIGAKPGVAEIQLGRLDQSFQFIVEVGLQEEDNAHGLQNLGPLLCRDPGDPCGGGQLAIIHKLPAEGRAGPQKLPKANGVRDPIVIHSVPHEIGFDIGIPVLTSLFLIQQAHLWHSTPPDVRKSCHDVILSKQPASCRQRRAGEVKRLLRLNSRQLPLGQAVQLQNTYAAGQRVTGLTHQLFALGTSQPEESTVL